MKKVVAFLRVSGKVRSSHGTSGGTHAMNEIITQLIASAIDANKIPSLDCFDMARRPRGEFEIVLNDGTRIRITTEIID